MLWLLLLHSLAPKLPVSQIQNITPAASLPATDPTCLHQHQPPPPPPSPSSSFPSSIMSAELYTGLGAALALFFSGVGAAAASAPAGLYVLRATPQHGLKSFFPIVIGGVLAVYGIIVAVILSSKIEDGMSAIVGYKALSSGLAVGLACLASGLGMARFLTDAVTGGAINPKAVVVAPEGQPLLPGGINGNAVTSSVPAPSWELFLVMVYFEAIGLYGLIVALFLAA